MAKKDSSWIWLIVIGVLVLFVYKQGGFNFILHTIITDTTSISDCFQETANNANIGEASLCGAKSSGTYNIEVGFADRALLINYTKPDGAMSDSLWQIKHGPGGSPTLANYTFPKTCWDAYSDKLVLKAIVYKNCGACSNLDMQCWDASTWVNIVSTGGGEDGTSQGEDTIGIYGYDGNYGTGIRYSPYTRNFINYASTGGTPVWFWEEGIWWKIKNNYISAPVPQCGNNLIESGETCDGTQLAGKTCQSLGFSSGTLSCNPTCTGYVTSNCANTGTCGNGNIDLGELCDLGNLGGKTCQNLGYTNGTLACNSNCLNYAASGCFTNQTQCNSYWQCGSYGACSNGTQSRSCVDINNCTTANNLPQLNLSCIATPASKSNIIYYVIAGIVVVIGIITLKRKK